jgi:hypothetical protein
VALRDPDFEVVEALVFGDLDPRECPLKVAFLWDAKPFSSDMMVGIKVTKTDGGELKVKDVVPLKLLLDNSNGSQEAIWDIYLALARKLSFQLFELDPRIGLPLTTNSMVPFPNSPLFDPPYITTTYVRYLCDAYDRDERLKPEEAQVSRQLKQCPFCERSIRPFGKSREPGVWCGGNVGFAHEECAPWVTPRPSH